MNLNQNFQLFKREYPSWKTYSKEDLRLATIEFCRKHNIISTSDPAELLYWRLLSHIPIPPLPQKRQNTYKPPKQQVTPPRNQSFQGIQQTHQGIIPSPIDDPLQSQQQQSVTDLNKSLQEFMRKTEEYTSSKNLLSQFQNQQGLGRQGQGQQGVIPQGLMQQY